ncbi:hypothetical protein [Magnetococcus sp. PR-3]|uniref:hypothetical protein n=1 Tax=Magnetococcus sp. PR-3 TaxID=3120355 RepID=UPI002FCE3F28
MKIYRFFPRLAALGLITAVVGLGGMAYFADSNEELSNLMGTIGYVGLYLAIVTGLLTMMFMPSDR